MLAYDVLPIILIELGVESSGETTGEELEEEKSLVKLFSPARVETNCSGALLAASQSEFGGEAHLSMLRSTLVHCGVCSDRHGRSSGRNPGRGTRAAPVWKVGRRRH